MLNRFSYLQFFFNLSLILIFLYLFVQFIITVQRDVEHRISEFRKVRGYAANNVLD